MKAPVIIFAGLLMAGTGFAQQNLLPNGNFDHPEDPLFGWTHDYSWQGNQHFMANHHRIRIVPQEGTRRNVLSLELDPQTKIESLPMPYEQGARYRCTLHMKGGRGRFYFAGYRWKPGVRPYDNPHPGDLRMVYRSRAVMDVSRDWKTISFEFPLDERSDMADRHLQQVRFFTIYIWAGDEEKRGQQLFVDNVRLQRIR